MKAIQSGTKENRQGTNNEGKETWTQINDLEKREINIQPEHNEETRIQRKEEKLRNLWDNLNVPTSESSCCQKEKRKSKKLKTYLKT